MEKGLKLTQSHFIDIEGRYGFDQNALAGRWSRYHVDRSCGIAAMANLISYGRAQFVMSRSESFDLMDRPAGHFKDRRQGHEPSLYPRRAFGKSGKP